MNDDNKGGFYTQAGYERKSDHILTPAAEDYLEMIYRLSEDGRRPVRVKDLAGTLHVSPSSASRMAGLMSAHGYVNFKRYGYITLTDSGLELGQYLIRRHNTVVKFLSLLRGEECDIEEAERIEHYISPSTTAAMERRIGEVEQSGQCTSPSNTEEYLIADEQRPLTDE